MQDGDRTIECIAPVALAVMIDEYAIFGPKLSDRLSSFLGVSLPEHLVEIAFDEGLYHIRPKLSRILALNDFGNRGGLILHPPAAGVAQSRPKSLK